MTELEDVNQKPVYRIFQAAHLFLLEEIVNGALSAGFRVCGGMHTEFDEINGRKYYQAMIYEP